MLIAGDCQRLLVSSADKDSEGCGGCGGCVGMEVVVVNLGPQDSSSNPAPLLVRKCQNIFYKGHPVEKIPF